LLSIDEQQGVTAMRGSYPENFRSRGQRSQGRDYEDQGRERDSWRDERRFEGDWNQYGSDRNYNQDYDEYEDRDREWNVGPGGQYRGQPRRGGWGGHTGGFGSARGRYLGYQRGSDRDEPRSQYGGGYGGQWREPQRRMQTPKGYTRSDERIREDVCERLAECQFDISNVSVDVKQGKVTLDGSVSERRMKHQIEDIADNCMGVKDVDNKLRIQREGESSGFGESESGSTRSSKREH
jgi:osmotically-inducible protein OsmY